MIWSISGVFHSVRTSRIPFATLLLILLTGCIRPAERQAPALEKLNVVVIVVDTLYARHLGCYNPKLQNSPTIDALAKNGALFTNAFAVSPWTKPSIASIATSRLPSRHGVTGAHHRIPPDQKMMAELFEERGFQTFGVTSHIYLNKKSGYGKGFQDYEQVNTARGLHSAVTSDAVSNAAIAWLSRRNMTGTSRPFFMFLHYFDPHFRYVHHPAHSLTGSYSGPLKPNMSIAALMKRRQSFTPEDIEYLKNLYREEIAFTDSQIARVLEELRQRSLLDKTLVVLTADHGEEFMEHGSLTHTWTLFDEVLRIPLIFSLPGVIAPGTYDHPVSQLDILPSLFSFAQPAITEATWEGSSLKSLLLGGKSEIPDRDLFAEVSYSSIKDPRKIDPDMISIRSGKFKLIHDRKQNRWSLFDTEEDPAEQKNIAARESKLVHDLAERLEFLEKLHAHPGSTANDGDVESFSPQDMKSLKSLGYIN